MSEEGKYCPNCHAKNKKESKFCIKCGVNIEEKEENTEEITNDESSAKNEKENKKLISKEVNNEKKQKNFNNQKLNSSKAKKGSFIHFDRMIAPVIIKFLYWIGVVLSTIIGIFFIIDGVDSYYYYGGGSIFVGFLIIILSPFITRIISERAIVIFKIHETLEEIKSNQNLL